MRSALFWASVPLLLPQALVLRHRAPRFAPADGPTRGGIGEGGQDESSMGEHQPLRLLGLGDSIIAGVGATSLSVALLGQTAAALSRQLRRRIEWAAHGQSGADSRQLLQTVVPALATREADFVLLSVGVNDVTSLAGLRRWRRNLDALLKAMRANSPRARIAFAGLPPLASFPLLPQPLRTMLGLRARQFDAVARRDIARHAGVVHVPLPAIAGPGRFCADGFHPSESSCAELGGLMAAALLGCGPVQP